MTTLTVYKNFDINSGEKYHPDKYYWPVFSLKNYKQNFTFTEGDVDGDKLKGWWFIYTKSRRRIKKREIFFE